MPSAEVIGWMHMKRDSTQVGHSYELLAQHLFYTCLRKNSVRPTPRYLCGRLEPKLSSVNVDSLLNSDELAVLNNILNVFLLDTHIPLRSPTRFRQFQEVITLEPAYCADSQLSFIVLSCDNLRHSGLDSWMFLFSGFLKGAGGGVGISEDSAVNRLLFFLFFCCLTVSNAVCLSGSFTL